MSGTFLCCAYLIFSFIQEPAKEDLTVSEKFQLVLDVAQKAQVNVQLNAYIFSDFYFNTTLSITFTLFVKNLDTLYYFS